MTPEEILAAAQRIAEEVLYPAAIATDRAAIVPVTQLDTLAASGFYGLPGPVDAGGLGADFETLCAVIEILAGACLTTTFVWVQHLGAVRAAAASTRTGIKDRWLLDLGRGACRAGVALTGLIPGPSQLTARPVPGGVILDGIAPWVSGWERIDVIHAAARDPDDNVVWSFVDATEGPTLRVERLDLVAIQASATVRLRFQEHLVHSDRIVDVVPPSQWSLPNPGTIRVHAAMILGVASRCCALLGPGPMEDELAGHRAALDQAMAAQDFGAMAQARAGAAEFALRASGRLMVSTGSRSVLLDQHPQRLAREALFFLVYGSRPQVKAALLERLASRRVP
ncbi:MAG TPA: acyl-CoA dehydrogenase family protein [Candidatus Limnocylindrales bacterium]|nr:acyl-CoA dehydrogenase family protein [Candidatus Limnocylindrales bacterium]